MAKIKPQMLADQLISFRNTIEEDYQMMTGRRTVSPSDSFHKDIFYDYWLRCETSKDRQNRLSLCAAARDLQRQSHQVYYEQYQRQNSRLWKNLSAPAAPIYAKWLKECPHLTARGYRTTVYNYAFSPTDTECLERALQKVSQFINGTAPQVEENLDFPEDQILDKMGKSAQKIVTNQIDEELLINQKQPSRHLKDLAKSYYETLLKSLFDKTGGYQIKQLLEFFCH